MHAMNDTNYTFHMCFKLEVAVNLSSSSDTNTNDHDTNQNSSTNRTDVGEWKLSHFQYICKFSADILSIAVSLDENMIDFESRKVKERRAHDEVSTGKYRHPNFVTSTISLLNFYQIKKINKLYHFAALAYEDCNMIDINPESSISVSNSNSMLSKSPVSFTTATDDGGKGSISSTPYAENQVTRNCSTDAMKYDGKLIVHQLGTGTSVSPSENDSRIPSISQQSAAELKPFCHSESNYSAQSWGSIISLDSPSEDEALEFMRRFVAILFEDSSLLSQELKSEFGEKSRVSLIRWHLLR